MVTVETTQVCQEPCIFWLGIFNQSTEEMHTRNNNDLNHNNSDQAEVIDVNVEFSPTNIIQQQFRKSKEVKQLTNKEKIRKLQNIIQNFNNRLNQHITNVQS